MLDGLMIDPIAFSIGEFPIYWHGILIAIGIAISAAWAGRAIERRGQSSDDWYNGLLIVVLAGYAFARLGYVLYDEINNVGTQYTFVDIFNIRDGGASLLSGFIGAALVAVWYLNWRKLSSWDYADIAGMATFLALAIGRWGNFINQELYGVPTTLPWGILVDASKRIAPYNDLVTYPLEIRFHPLFLYESLSYLIGFGVLFFLNRKYQESWKPGSLFGIFLIWWGITQTFVEALRPTAAEGFSITVSMYAYIFMALFGGLVLLYVYEKLPQSERDKHRHLREGRIRKPKIQRDQTDA